MSAILDQVFNAEVRQLRDSLHTHPVFSRIRDVESLRAFMQVHIYAVWDFMSLAKRLQRDLTCVDLPWMPPADIEAAHLINEIILGEETDTGPDGHPISHMDLYLHAMREVGADTRPFEQFLSLVRERVPVENALGRVGAPNCVIDFVSHTLKVAIGERTLVVMANFFYGRENVIPGMFQRLLDSWGLDRAAAPSFVYYLDRHIELDGDAHGPAAEAIISRALTREPHLAETVRKAAIASLTAREKLWDGTDRLLAKLPGAKKERRFSLPF
ncbi:DUF3050 domain-containing protein [Tahibacter amnicola]|uniref:DUF3050 domain-containing protein n=1 Tax=Tahibacter amnicola TaxID=2976241 RepID=A0ABY6BFE7_9GAMM|nr:DUF3050 domain-containing protein [Tahibacter amnicola]UXI68507.1 DUF3050 domain-containing protein [Tahibacter amnicola]